jgi:hypothetical protein
MKAYKNVLEMTDEDLKAFVIHLMEDRGMPAPPVGIKFDYLITRMVRGGQISMDYINEVLNMKGE